MTVFQMADAFLFKPLMLLFEVIYTVANTLIADPGLSIIALSLAMNFLVLPLYRRADALQEEERETEERLKDGVAHIKKVFKGDEKMMILDTYYRQNHYKPTDVMKGAVSLLLQIPFFVAAYRFLSELPLLTGAALGPIENLAVPDGLIHVFGLTLNALPILMTVINLISCVIFTKGATLKSRLQLYGMAVFFLFFLYDSPSGLVFYWTLNNVFSLGKTIFYKLKDPKGAFRILLSLGSIGLSVSIPFFEGDFTEALFLVAFSVILQLPLLIFLAKEWLKARRARKGMAPKAPRELRLFAGLTVPDHALMFRAGLFLAVLIGLVIPTGVIKSSPQEFIHIAYYESPVWIIVNCFMISAGTFVLWAGIFYRLFPEKGKGVTALLFLLFAVAGVANYMFFGKNLPNLSPSLIYNEELTFSSKELILNLALLLFIAAGLLFAVRYLRKYVRAGLLVLTLALALMLPSGLRTIKKDADTVKNYTLSEDGLPVITMTDRGTNVVVIMLDRLLGEYLPYIFNELPGLKTSFDGFTAYENVISFGRCTNIGGPGIFGGYEYTPVNMNLRRTELLKDKHNEAIRVLPTLFSENGYQVTQVDPILANYQWTSDLSVFDDIENSTSYHAIGLYEPRSSYDSWKESVYRNFFCYGFMKCSPLAVQPFLYESGRYRVSFLPENTQYFYGLSRAEGYPTEFANSYSVLEHLKTSTVLSKEGTDQFLVFTCDAPHQQSILSEPDYSISSSIDNTVYDSGHIDRFTLDGETYVMDEADSMAHYCVNAACYLELARWFDVLREMGVYDNTKIIIVSDHGRYLPGNDADEVLEDAVDWTAFYPVLLVKEIGATGFRVSDELMTNADVPALATAGVIENALNPFTGNPLYDPDAKSGPLYILNSTEYDIKRNCGTRFLPGNWYKITGGDVRDSSSWENAGTDTYLPEGY